MEALILLAEAVDELAERPVDPVADPWAGWGKQPTDTGPAPTTSVNYAEVEAEIADLAEQLHNNDDPEDSKVLRAKIALAKDKLVEPPKVVDLEQQRTIQVSNGGDVTVEVPVPDEETVKRRGTFLDASLYEAMREQYGEEGADQFSTSYMKAGPLLLYYTDRDFVNGLPDRMKFAMVEDVEHFSPNEAAEMARDILKDLTPGAERKDILVEATESGVQ